MNNTNTGGPAFPCDRLPTLEGKCITSDGMTLRDYFAAKAMQGAIASSSDQLDFGPDLGAAWAYQVADAMLKARSA
jgi:hypothetical protein